MKEPLISVIIATKNEEKNIANCLESITRQEYPKERIEIIVVDNASSDRTREIARRFTGNVFNLAEEIDLNNVRNFRGAQVNFGATRSHGSVIFFPDADMTFHKGLFREAIEMLDRYDALFVPEIIKGRGFFGKIRNFERSFYNKTCIDAIRFIKTDVFTAVGGFDAKDILFGFDDWDLTLTIKNVGYTLGVTKRAITHHEEWLNWRIYIRKKGKYLHTYEPYIKKWGTQDHEVKKQFSIGKR
jgi:glycosyltransferase involved in cell wall biosynthesis